MTKLQQFVRFSAGETDIIVSMDGLAAILPVQTATRLYLNGGENFMIGESFEEVSNMIFQLSYVRCISSQLVKDKQIAAERLTRVNPKEESSETPPAPTVYDDLLDS